MKKHLTSIGGSLGFIIDKPIADLYRLDRNTVLEVTPKEDGLNIKFLRGDSSEIPTDDEVLSAAKNINNRYNKMMKNLAK